MSRPPHHRPRGVKHTTAFGTAQGETRSCGGSSVIPRSRQFEGFRQDRDSKEASRERGEDGERFRTVRVGAEC